MPTAYLGIGSNLGDRLANVSHAVEQLAQFGRVRQSPWYETSPADMSSGREFVNGVVEFDSALAPFELLELAQAVERDLGRLPRADLSRPIDIDILFFGAVVLSIGTLAIPHPGVAMRPFVLVPLVQLAPGLRHPVFGLTVSEMLERVGNTGVRSRIAQ